MVDATKNGGVNAIVEYDYTAKEPDEIDLVKGAIIKNIKQMPGGWWEGTLQTNGKTGMFPDNFVRIVDMNEDNTVVLRDKTTTSNRRCKVIYSYTQVNDDELSLAVGDVIEFLGEVEEGWWRGRLKNKIGVFPSNFVKLIESSPVFASKRPPSSGNSFIGNIATSAVNKTVNAVAVSSSTMSASAASASSTLSSSSSTVATKKLNRLSFHSSKEDLLNSSNVATTTTTASNNVGAASSSYPGIIDDGAPSLPPKPLRDYCRVEFPYAPQNEDELELKLGDIITIHSMELPDKGWWKGELRGKVGVFPDNFVKLMAPTEVSPLNDTQQQQQQSQPQQSHRTTAKLSSTTTSTNTTSNNNTAATNVKTVIKKSGSSSSTQSSNRKDSFGSRDSLNDILSETGLPTGNVAAQRKSLENKNFDLSSNASDVAARLAQKKQQQMYIQQQQETKTTTNITSSNSNSTAISANSSSELRKSLENMDEKPKTIPPPVLNKKPSVPVKKTTTVTSITGNILSGIKQKVKNVENKLTTASSHDYADGVVGSKLSQSPVAEMGGGNVVMRRAATISVEDADFDRVERGSILPDVRAGRVKAPKRRPPSAAISAMGENNNNNSLYVNGNDNGSDTTQSGDDQLKSDDNSEEQLAKPKPREWEKKKAPWMEELKMSQVKKKTSPNMSGDSTTVGERTSKLFGDDAKISNNLAAAAAATSTNSSQVSSTSLSTNSASSTTSTKVQSSSVSSTSIIQQSMIVESSSSSSHSSSNATAKTLTEAMTKSLSAKIANDAAIALSNSNATNNTSLSSNSSTTNTTVDDVRARPNSLSIRNNRSASPSMAATRNILKSNTTTSSSTSSALPAVEASSSNSHTSTNTHSTVAKSAAVTTNNSTALVNNHHHPHQTHPPSQPQPHPHHQQNNGGGASSAKGDGNRVAELESRVDKLERLIQTQQRTIDDLVRTLREESDRTKVLRSELDKYAQCVTQV